MEDQEFDQALRGLAQGSRLPYDARQWEHMAQRLQAHEAASALPRRRTIPFYQWAAAAAAACLVVMAGLYISKTPEVRITKQGGIAPQQSAAPRIAEDSPAGAETAAIADQKKDGPQAGRETAPVQKSSPQRAVIIAGQMAGPSYAAVSKPADPKPQPEAAPVKAAAAVVPQAPVVAERPPQLAHVPPTRADYPLPEEQRDVIRERRTAFGVHGGYNIGSAKNNFTLGVSVKQKLSERLHLETGLAFVSGAYKTYEPVVTTTTTFTSSGGGIGPQNVQTTTVQTYEASSNHLLYLQAAPTLNYRIYKGLTAGGGVDAQRLLGGNNTDAISLNSLGEETASQPQWDFGVTARMDVQVARKLRAGMMYRESMRGVSKSAQEAARRNYLLLQLSYTLF